MHNQRCKDMVCMYILEKPEEPSATAHLWRCRNSEKEQIAKQATDV